jgi:hypothetical protein
MTAGDIGFEEADVVGSPLVDRVLRLLQHLYIDETSDNLLELLVTALCSPLEPTAEVAFGNDDTDDPWRVLTDPSIASDENLAYSTQWAGGIMPVQYEGESVEDYFARARLEIEWSRGPKRGSEHAAAIVADPFLSGTKHLVFTYDVDEPNIVYVDVLDAEVDDMAGLFKALNHQDVVVAGERFERLPTALTWNNNTSGHTWDGVSGTKTWDTATSGV